MDTYPFTVAKMIECKNVHAGEKFGMFIEYQKIVRNDKGVILSGSASLLDSFPGGRVPPKLIVLSAAIQAAHGLLP